VYLGIDPTLGRLRHVLLWIVVMVKNYRIMEGKLCESGVGECNILLYRTTLLSIVNNNISVLMKTLTIITISIMVPTFVVSLFSMNVGIPLSERAWAFWAILGAAGVASGVVAFIWRFRGRAVDRPRRTRRPFASRS